MGEVVFKSGVVFKLIRSVHGRPYYEKMKSCGKIHLVSLLYDVLGFKDFIKGCHNVIKF